MHGINQIYYFACSRRVKADCSKMNTLRSMRMVQRLARKGNGVAARFGNHEVREERLKRSLAR